MRARGARDPKNGNVTPNGYLSLVGLLKFSKITYLVNTGKGKGGYLVSTGKGKGGYLDAREHWKGANNRKHCLLVTLGGNNAQRSN